MTIFSLEDKKVLVPVRKGHQSWQQRFRKKLYLDNYMRCLSQQDTFSTPGKMEAECEAANSLMKVVHESSEKRKMGIIMQNEFFDPQVFDSCFSPYTVYIPLEGESFQKDEFLNTFSYLLHLSDCNKEIKLDALYKELATYFDNAKLKGEDFVNEQWKKAKNRFICPIDSLKAVSLYIQMLRQGSHFLTDYAQKNGFMCKWEITFFRVTKCSHYFHRTEKMHSHVKVSIDIKEEINEVTLPLTMKIFFCALCGVYDCQHKIDNEAVANRYQYISAKNRKREKEQIEKTVRLLRCYESLQKGEPIEHSRPLCGFHCFMGLRKEDLAKLNTERHKLISPLAKALLKLGIEMFSFDPCSIERLFQSKDSQGRTAIHCSLIFLHFAEECTLTRLLELKVQRSETAMLLSESNREEKPLLKAVRKKTKGK